MTQIRAGRFIRTLEATTDLVQYQLRCSHNGSIHVLFSFVAMARGRLGVARTIVGRHFMATTVLMPAWAVIFAVTAATLAPA